MFKKNSSTESVAKSTSFTDEMSVRCAPKKLVSVGAIAVLTYVAETALKTLAGVNSD